MSEIASQDDISRKEALQLAKEHRLVSLRSPTGKLFQFTKADFPGFCPKEENVSLFPLCMEVWNTSQKGAFLFHFGSPQDLSNTLKLIFDECKRTKSICQLQEGTVLGAVKLGGILPWERDADIMVHSNNFSYLLDHLSNKVFPWIATQSNIL